MRYKILSGLAVGFLATVGVAAPAQAISATSSDVYVVHGIPGLTVDVYVNDALTLEDFTFGTVAGPLDLPAGDYKIQVFAADADPATATPAIDVPAAAVPANQSVSLVAQYDASGNPKLGVFVNDISTIPAGQGTDHRASRRRGGRGGHRGQRRDRVRQRLQRRPGIHPAPRGRHHRGRRGGRNRQSDRHPHLGHGGAGHHRRGRQPDRVRGRAVGRPAADHPVHHGPALHPGRGAVGLGGARGRPGPGSRRIRGGRGSAGAADRRHSSGCGCAPLASRND